MAEAARLSVLDRYDPLKIAQEQLAPLIRRFERPRRKLRILAANVFFSPRSFGGATIVVEQIAKRLNARADTEVVIFTSAPPGLAPAYELLRYKAGEIPVFAVSLPETVDPVFSFDTPFTVQAFRDVLRLTRPDVVHLHSIQGLGARLLEVCDEEKVPAVVTLHDAWWICGRQFMITAKDEYCFQEKIDLNICSSCVSDAGLNVFRQYRLKELLARATVLLAPSRFFAKLYQTNLSSGQTVIVNKNGVAEPVEFDRKTSDHIRFGFVGGNSIVKGADLVRDVFSKLGRSDYELVLVDNLQSLGFNSLHRIDWEIEGRLTILPSYTQENMNEFYENIDVLLFPTQWKESFGLTVREALIRDIWVIATDAGGVIEDLVQGENGVIIPLTDDGTALRAAVLDALEQKDRLKAHVNPYKGQIATYSHQATELHDILAKAAGPNHTLVAPSHASDAQPTSAFQDDEGRGFQKRRERETLMAYSQP